MPLTTAEKSKKYRERLKNNTEKYESSKEKSRARSAKQYQKKKKEMDESKKNEMRLIWRQKYASKKLQSLPSSTGPISNESQSEMNNIDVEGHGQPRSAVDQVHDIDDHEGPSATGQKRIQRNVVKILRRENAQLHAKINNLERGFNTLKREMRQFKKKYKQLIQQLKKDTEEKQQKETAYVAVPTQEDTPMKRSDEFIEKHLAEAEIETPKKEAIKRKIFEYNVLTDSLKQTYKSCQNPVKRAFKGVVHNNFVKKYKITTNLTKNLGLTSNIRKYKENKNAAKQLRERIRIFYEKDDVTRASAGKKECLVSKKCTKQKRYLSDKLSNLHKKYVKEVKKVSFSTFKKHRPFYVVAPNLKNLETCACLKHANMQFIINGLKSAGVLKSNDLNHIISRLVCDHKFKQCMYDECSVCTDHVIEVNDIEIDKTVKWFAWALKDHVYNEKGNTKTSKRMVKMVKTGSIKELLDLFHSELKAFKRHVFNVKYQYQQYSHCIENLESNEAAIHIDFSENWVCKYHEEVQAMHFGASQNQITLHTGVLYVKDEDPFSFCSISAENSHGPEAIWAHLHPILEHIRAEYPNINTLHFHSDGPTTQYRQKKNFFLLCKTMYELGLNATWWFFEAAHGKGAADGIGGSVKRSLDLKVSRGLDIPDAQTAFEVLQNEDSSVKMFLIPPENIQPLDTSVVSKLRPIPNTMKIHQLITHSKFALKHRILSCFCQSLQGKCECHNPALHIFDFNENSETDCETENVDDILLDETTGEIIKNNITNFNENSDKTENLDYTIILDEMTGENCTMKRKIHKTNLQNNKRLKKNTKPIKEMNQIHSSEEEDEYDNYSVHDTSDSLDYLDEKDLTEVTDESEEVNDEIKEVSDESKEVNNAVKNAVTEVNDESEEVNDNIKELSDESKEVNDESKEVNNEYKDIIYENDFEHSAGTEIEIKKGSYVLVKFLTAKRSKNYIGEVTEIYENSYKVKFLRNKGRGRFAWPINEDVSVVYRTDIDQILQNPISERRGIKTFDIEHLNIRIE